MSIVRFFGISGGNTIFYRLQFETDFVDDFFYAFFADKIIKA